MYFRLGDLVVRHLQLLHLIPVRPLWPTEQALERLWEDLRHSAGSRPDLLREAQVPIQERGVLFELEGRLTRRGAQHPLLLHWCEFVPGVEGFLSLAVTDLGRLRRVRAGDGVCGGFVLHREGLGPLQVFPRLFRKLCHNGQVMPLGEQGDVLQHFESPAAAWDYCLSAEFLEDATSLVRRSTLIPLGNPRPLFDWMPHPEMRQRALYEWKQARDPSLWGAINAITASARRIVIQSLRLDYETKAGEILASEVRAAGLGRMRSDLHY